MCIWDIQKIFPQVFFAKEVAYNTSFFKYKGGTLFKELPINTRISAKEVRVISKDGDMLGVMSTPQAMRLADEAELDLVLISPTASPPVAKIIDYG